MITNKNDRKRVRLQPVESSSHCPVNGQTPLGNRNGHKDHTKKDIVDDIKNPLMRALSPIFHQYADRIKSLKFANLRNELTLTLVIEA